LIFYPERTLEDKPDLPYEDVRFNAADGTRLHAWFIPFEGSRRAFLVSHGNAGNIGNRAVMGEFIHREFRTSILMYDYRGYGNSEGKPSEEGLYSDIQGAFRYLQSRGFAAASIYLLGQSLGTAVTIDFASHEAVAGIILEAPFPSSRAVIRRFAFSLPIDYLLKDRFNSLSKVANVHSPIAVVHSRGDPVVPYELGQQLFAGIEAPKRFFSVEEAVHEGALMSLRQSDLKEIRSFFHIDDVIAP
jgi:fermentation-respiration switch protein FrsA (DUF1100 family)